jgi:stage V sporulation protein D (sporulation-specific penicillin-binding protein)
MERNLTFHRKKRYVMFLCILLCGVILCGRLVYLMVFRSEYYTTLAAELQQRERTIKAARGKILDRNGVVLASNKSVCTISVIHNQITDPEAVIAMLTEELGLSEESVRKRVEKYSSIEKIAGNVEKSIGDKILSYGLDGVKVDEDYKRTYPYDELASKVLGFTGADNQGILGLEVMYDEALSGTNGTILTYTDARGVEVENAAEERIEPTDGNHLLTTIDYNIQMYCTQAAEKAYLQKAADGVEIIAMNPQNGEIYAMVDYPEYNLNDPYTLSEDYRIYVGTEEESDYRNRMWRNWCVSDTYEPGSIFKTVTTAASLEEETVTLTEQFYCPGYIVVEDRRIRCHKTVGHGSESFVQALGNSCNPVFIALGLRLGAERYYNYMKQFGLFQKTAIDLPGEASTIMHSLDAIGEVELATMSFGQSFQVTPIQMATTVASLVNGGYRVTPHFGKAVVDDDGTVLTEFTYEKGEQICSEETSQTMRELLQYVVEEGGGANAYIEGYEIGGKTATSQTLPRSEQKYIASFIGFSPASDPTVLVMVIIRNPSGTYYGGTIAAPVAREIFENILPYLE